MAASKPMYFERLICLQVDVVTKVLRELLRCYQGAMSLDVFLLTYTADWWRLENNKVLSKDQVKILIPSGGAPCDERKLDVTLLTAVLRLRKACPLSGTEKDCIDQLKKIRNTRCAHATTTSLTQAEFEMTWKDVKTNLKKLARVVEAKTANHLYVNEIRDMIKDVYRQNPLEHYNTRLIEMFGEWCRIQVHESRQNIVLENILGFSEDFIGNPSYSQETDEIFSSTTLFQRLRQELENRPVVLTGMDEEETLVIAKELVKDAGEEGKRLVLHVSEDWSHVHFHNIDALLLLVDKVDIPHWATLARHALKENTLKLVMVCKNANFIDTLRRQYPMTECYFQNVQTDEYSVEDRCSILKQVIQELDDIPSTPDSEVEWCVNSFECPFGFMKICQELRRRPNLASRKRELFAYPFTILSHVLNTITERIKENDEKSSTIDMSLYFLFYKKAEGIEKNFLSPTKITTADKNTLSHVFGVVCQNSQNENIADARKHFDKLAGTVVKHEDGRVKFTNMMYETVAMRYAAENQTEVIEHCTFRFLLKHVGLGPCNEISAVIITLEETPEMTKLIAQRLAEEVPNLTTDIARNDFLRHTFLRHTSVIEAFFSNMNTNGKAKTFVETPMWKITPEGEEKHHPFDEGIPTSVWYCLTAEKEMVNSLFVLRSLESLQCEHAYTDDHFTTTCSSCNIRYEILLEAVIFGYQEIFEAAAVCARLIAVPDLSAVVRSNNGTFMSDVIQKLKTDNIWNIECHQVSEAVSLAYELAHTHITDAMKDHIPLKSELLTDAAKGQNLELVTEIVTYMESRPNRNDGHIFASALESSLRTGSLPIYRYLLEKGAELTPSCIAPAIQCFEEEAFDEFKVVLQETASKATEDEKIESLALALQLSKTVFVDEILNVFEEYIEGKAVTRLWLTDRIDSETKCMLLDSTRVSDCPQEISDMLVHTVRMEDCQLFTQLRERGAALNSECLYELVCLHYRFQTNQTTEKEKLIDVEKRVKETIAEIKRAGQWKDNDPFLLASVEMAFRSNDKSMYTYLTNAENIPIQMGCVKYAVRTGNTALIADMTRELRARRSFVSNCVEAGDAIVTALLLDIGYGPNCRTLTNFLRTQDLTFSLYCMEPAIKTGAKDLVELLIRQLQKDGLWDLQSDILARCYVMSLALLDNGRMHMLLSNEGICVSVKCLQIAVSLGMIEIVGRIIKELDHIYKWNAETIDSKDVAMAVLEAYHLPGKAVYQTLVENGARTTQQYLSVFARKKDLAFVVNIIEKINAVDDWDKSSPDIKQALKIAVSNKDESMCKVIMDNGVVFDTLFIVNAVLTKKISIVEKLVLYLKSELQQEMDPLCAELTESMVNTVLRHNTDVFKYLLKNGAMCPFKLLHDKAVNLKNFESAEGMITKLVEADVWEKENPTVLKTMHWLLEDMQDDALSVLRRMLKTDVKIVSETLQKASQTGNLFYMRLILDIAIRQGNFDVFSKTTQKFVKIAIERKDTTLFLKLLDQKVHITNDLLCLALNAVASTDGSTTWGKEEHVKQLLEVTKTYSNEIWNPEQKSVIKEAFALVKARPGLDSTLQRQGMLPLLEYLRKYVELEDKEMVQDVISQMKVCSLWDPKNDEAVRNVFARTIRSANASTEDPIWKVLIVAGVPCCSEYLSYAAESGNVALAEECLKGIAKKTSKLGLALNPIHWGSKSKLTAALSISDGNAVGQCLKNYGVRSIQRGATIAQIIYMSIVCICVFQLLFV